MTRDTLPDYMIHGKRRAYAHRDYKIGFKGTDEGINLKIEQYIGSNAAQLLLEGTLGGLDSTTTTKDHEGTVIYTEVRTEHTGELTGLNEKVRWVRHILPSWVPYSTDKYWSEDPEIRKVLNPTHNATTIYSIAKAPLLGDGVGFQSIKNKKEDWYGPVPTKLFFLDEKHDAENLSVFIANHDQYIEITDLVYKRFGPHKHYYEGSKWLSKHKNFKWLAEKLSDIVPLMNNPVKKVYLSHASDRKKDFGLGPFRIRQDEIDFGTDVYLVNRDERKKLLSSRRDFINWDNVIFRRPTLGVEAIYDDDNESPKLKYEVGVDATFFGAFELNPEYIKKLLIEHKIHSKPIRFPGKHNNKSPKSPM